MTQKKSLSLTDASLYAVVGMLGIRWLPVAAATGPSSLPLWVICFFTFYIPLSVATAEFTSRFPGDGSLYEWVRDSIGPLSGFLCGWFYWLSLFAYFANTVYFIAGLILGLAGLGKDPALFLTLSIAILAFCTAVQLLGLSLGKWLTNFGALGSWAVMALFGGVAALLLARGHSATDFSAGPWLAPASFDTAILWGTMVFGIAGSEMLGFLRNDLQGGMRTVVRALTIAGLLLLLAYAGGTAAMLVILPKAELTRLSGLPDAIQAAANKAGMAGFGAFGTGLFAASMLGGFTAWFGVGTRLPMEAGIDSFLPPIFARRHPRTGAPVAAIWLQAGLTLGIVVLGQAGESAASAYDLLVQLAVLATAIPYAMVFGAYIVRRRWHGRAPGEAWLPPGGARMGRVLGWTGLIATLIAIACTLVPDAHDAHPLTTFLKIVLSTAAALLIGLALYWLGTRRGARMMEG